MPGIRGIIGRRGAAVKAVALIALMAGCAKKDPGVAAVVPSSGAIAGGQAVRIEGKHFSRSGLTVLFDGRAATVVAVGGSAAIDVLTPRGTRTGAVDVRVSTRDGSDTIGAGYTYTLAAGTPFVRSISPTRGPSAGGTPVTIAGLGFATGLTVAFGGVPVALVPTPTGDYTVTVDTPAGTGTVDVTVTNSGGGSDTLAAAFTYDPKPVVSSVDPAAGASAGGTAVRVLGSGFLSGAQVKLGTTAATGVSVSSDGTWLTATTPAGTGSVDVTVTNTDSQTDTKAAAFTYGAQFLFVVQPGDTRVVTLSVDQTTGALSQVSVGNTGLGPTEARFYADQILVANDGASSLTLFDVNPTTGALTLTAQQPTPPAGTVGPLDLLMMRERVYVADRGTTGLKKIAVYERGTRAWQQLDNDGHVPYALFMDAGKTRLFSVNRDSGSISVFSTAALGLLGGASVSLGASSAPVHAAVGTDAVFVPLPGSGRVAAVVKGRSGGAEVWQAAPGSPFTCGLQAPRYATLSGQALFLYDPDDGRVASMRVNADNTLTQSGTGTLSAPGNGASPPLVSGDAFFVVGTRGGQNKIGAFKVTNASTAAFQAGPADVLTGGSGTEPMAVVHHGFLFVLNPSSPLVGVFEIGANAALASKSTYPLTGTDAARVVITP